MPTVSPEPTDSVKSAVFKNSEDTVKESRLENDFVRIWRSLVGCEPCTWQENRDGTGRETINGDFDAFLWLTNDWFYYAVHDEEKEVDTVYRAPVDNKSVPVYDVDRAEVLFQQKNFRGLDFMVTDSYILYSVYGKDNCVNAYYRYDFKTKKVTKAFGMAEDADTQVMQKISTTLPVTAGNAFFVEEDEQNIYRVSFDTFEKKKIYSGDITKSDYIAAYDGVVYFAPKVDQILRYDVESGEVSCVLDKSTFQETLEEMNLWDEKASKGHGKIGSLYTCQDRLYMDVEVIWYLKERVADGPSKGKTVKCGHNKKILISTDFSDFGKWEMEKGLTDYISEHAEKTLVWCNASDTTALYTIEELATIYFVDRGVVIFDINTDAPPVLLKGVSSDMMTYDMASGEIKKMDEIDYRNLETVFDYSQNL